MLSSMLLNSYEFHQLSRKHQNSKFQKQIFFRITEFMIQKLYF